MKHNNEELNIEFTQEHEINKSLPFLTITKLDFKIHSEHTNKNDFYTCFSQKIKSGLAIGFYLRCFLNM